MNNRTAAAELRESDTVADGEDAFLADFGRRLRSTRALRGMSRKTLSRASGLSERYIAQLEAGQGNVSILLLRRIAAAMGVRLEDLVSSSADPSWTVFRDLLQSADKDRIARAKAILAGADEREKRNGVAATPLRGIALIGLRGAGKSTLGKRLAQELGWPFLELNKEIEHETGLSVPEIIGLYGQEGFRRLEQNALRGLAGRGGPIVLATGGGIVSEPMTFDLVLSSFYTVWIKAQPEEHMERVRRQGDLRPMADDKSAMQELRIILASREPHYARADAVVDTSGLTIDEAAIRLRAAVEAAGPSLTKRRHSES
jgi:XRE family aerobic/anaerobic benzoate catabolism transcriptional regulator